MSKNKKDKVGYKNPPKEHQFKKGQSGNPNGRPKGSGNTLALAENILNERVSVREGGVQKEVSKTEAMIMRLVQKALEGDIKATEKALKMAEKIDKRNDKYEQIIDYVHRRISEGLRRAQNDSDILTMLDELSENGASN